MPFQNKKADSRRRSHYSSLALQNARLTRRIWDATPEQFRLLKNLTEEFHLSVALGDLKLLDSKWYVTHAGLLRLAQRRRCTGIKVQQIREFCDPAAGRWVFKATLYKRAGTQGFVGFGDADPSNVSTLVRGAEMRVAETRAVNRALRKAYGIGLCSVEELGSLGSSSLASPYELPARPTPQNGSNNGQPRLKDKLCLLIRQYNLDATLVKAYAADFCGTETLRGATRELVESFISHLEAQAKDNRDSLICKLNSYAHPTEVHS
jgi:hypothetical protein